MIWVPHCLFHLDQHIGRFPFNQKFRNFRNGGKWSRNFLGIFPKCESFNRKFGKFREEYQMERKFQVRNFEKICVYLARLTSFPEIPKNAVPFATENFRKCKPEVLAEWKAPMVINFIIIFQKMQRN